MPDSEYTSSAADRVNSMQMGPVSGKKICICHVAGVMVRKLLV